MVDQQGASIAECLAFCSQLLANLVRLEYLMVEFYLVSGQKPFKFGLRLSHVGFRVDYNAFINFAPM